MTQIPEDIRALIPWESQFFNYKDGLRIHYFDVGSKTAPVIVCVHGNPTWSFYFRSIIKKFSSQYRVIAIDFIGMGLSSKYSGDARRAIDRSDELDSLLSNLGIQKFSLLMHDWGGPIGTHVAIKRLKDLQSIIYLNTTLTETESLPPFIKMAASGPFSKIITATTTQFLHFTTRLGCNRSLSKAVRNAYFLPFPNIASRRAVYDFVRDIPFSTEHPTHRDLANLAIDLPKLRDIPILILWGLKDPVFHRGMLKRVASHFPHAKVIEYPDASHLLLEDKSEQVGLEIEEFLNNNLSKIKSTSLNNPEIEINQDKSLIQAFFKSAIEFSDQSASIEVKLPGLLSTWPISKLITSNSEAINYDMLSFKDLKAKTLQYQRGLLALGLTPGKRIVMLLSPGHDFLAFSFAIMACGAIPVFIDPGIGINRLCECISEVDPAGCIISARAQLLLLLKHKIFKNMHLLVNASKLPIGFGTGLDFFSAFSAAETELPNFKKDDPALIAFTSGATGIPKGVIFTNGMLVSQLDIFRDIFGIKGGKADLPLLPIFSIYGASAGVTTIFYPNSPGHPLDLNPAHICKVIKDLSIETSFGSPTLWAKIVAFAATHDISLNSLKKIFMAGTSVPNSTINQVSSVCSKAEIFTPYGATECLPITLSPSKELPIKLEESSNKMQGIAVGKPIAGLKIKIIPIVDAPIKDLEQVSELPVGQIGELIVCGPNISSQYCNRTDANQRFKINDFNSIWHRIGDACYLGNDGNIYYCGRVAHRVVTRDKDDKENILYSEPTEIIFNQNIKVRRSALIAVANGSKAAIAIEPHPEYFPKSQDAYFSFVSELRELAKSCDFTKEIADFYFFHHFPVDARHNAKVFRDVLGNIASSGKADFTG